MHVHFGIIKKATAPLDKTMINVRFHLLDVISYFSARQRCREQIECTSPEAVLELYGDWRQT